MVWEACDAAPYFALLVAVLRASWRAPLGMIVWLFFLDSDDDL